MAKRDSSFWVAMIGAGIISALLVGAMLAATQGKLIYSLDDPYIHLALARRIAEGGYGINPGEFASPSSSILWPLLLAPFARLPFADVVPLLLCIASTGVTCGSLLALAKLGVGDRELPCPEWILSVVILAAGLGLNLFGIIALGMEHSLHTALACLTFMGLARLVQNAEVTPPLLVGIAVAPLIRYEALGLSLAAAGLLWWIKRDKSWTIVFVPLVGLAGFSSFLLSLGLPPLPSSTLAKSSSYSPLPLSIVERLGRQLASQWEQTILPNSTMVVSLIVILGAILALLKGKERLLGGVGVAALLFHLLLGQFRGYYRYEVYLCVALFGLGMFALLRGWDRKPFLPAAALLGGFVVLALDGSSIQGTLSAPRGSRNIYEQQYHTSLFIRDHWKKPLAVNDLGCPAFYGGQYLLDLWGLGSPDALKERRLDPRAPGLDRLVKKRKIEAVAIYREWFHDLPADWKEIGSWSLKSPQVSAGGKTVTLFSTSRASDEGLRAAFESFRGQYGDAIEFASPLDAQPQDQLTAKR